ncbi:MAG: glucosaminidase domain-containing protein [Eubacteriales bacterium]|nr:glucosaminidase domain-containing protein [Eubacteriales bacterium]
MKDIKKKLPLLLAVLCIVCSGMHTAAEEGNISPGGEGSFFYNSSGFVNSETYHGELYYDSNESFIEVIGAIAREDMKCSGILASVTVAQAILESGFGTTGLATGANNLFGIKATLSGNNWENSTWDGVSVYTARTAEQTASGKEYYIVADFRAYTSIVDSVGDHSAYLLGAVNGDHFRYDGLQYQTDYRVAAQIIKNGGYATDVRYVDKLCSLIETYNLTRFDQPEDTLETETETEFESGTEAVDGAEAETKSETETADGAEAETEAKFETETADVAEAEAETKSGTEKADGAEAETKPKMDPGTEKETVPGTETETETEQEQQ